jgi:hypothetical protein
MENTYLGRDDTSHRDELSLRGKLAIEASKDLTVELAAFHFDFDNGYDAFSLDNTRETLSDESGKDTQKTSAFSAKFTYEGIENFSLMALISHSDPAVNPNIDPDFVYWEYSSTDYYFRKKSVQTFELRAVSNASSKLFNDSTSWVVGAYLKQDDSKVFKAFLLEGLFLCLK